MVAAQNFAGLTHFTGFNISRPRSQHSSSHSFYVLAVPQILGFYTSARASAGQHLYNIVVSSMGCYSKSACTWWKSQHSKIWVHTMTT
ncbi:hypothetical protein WJX84_011373 [Apatococcus fuscideae]|uniref:Uncharacterized protein n=1 Tax=Apatococcus fuscideae TaxID=2026836 RepID=A0AAW1SW59_9CHLO